MARFSTHVLDTARGVPAEGITIRLYSASRDLLAASVTNADGRISTPDLQPGNYELEFHAGDYFRKLQVHLTDPPFLDVILIRFGVSDAHGKYHVPLLLSPYGYSTYRGS